MDFSLCLEYDYLVGSLGFCYRQEYCIFKFINSIKYDGQLTQSHRALKWCNYTYFYVLNLPCFGENLNGECGRRKLFFKTCLTIFHLISPRSASKWRGRFGAMLTSTRAVPDALPLRSILETRSRRAGQRTVSVDGRRTLNTCCSGVAEVSSVGPANILLPSAGNRGNENAICYTWRAGFFASDDPRGVCASNTTRTSRRSIVSGARASGKDFVRVPLNEYWSED